MTENNDDPFDVPPHIALRAADIPYAFARKHGVVMLAGDGERLEIAVREGSDPRVLLEVRRHLARSFDVRFRSEEHTSELQSLMRISYAVFCLKKKTRHNTHDLTRYTP